MVDLEGLITVLNYVKILYETAWKQHIRPTSVLGTPTLYGEELESRSSLMTSSDSNVYEVLQQWT